ncbi:MAG TPA: hypothetical protein VF412_03180 [Bdellovibrio sp.]|uniref:hypothetical protein n=1 Tax=Bdellovibrio sp. TaxID=28201 RepID=UPI002EEAF9AA
MSELKSSLSQSREYSAIEGNLLLHGVEPNTIRQVKDDEILWAFHTFNRISCIMRLYGVGDDLFLSIETAFGVVDTTKENAEVSHRIAIENTRIPNLARVGIYRDQSVSLCVIQIWFQCGHVDPSAIGGLIELSVDQAEEIRAKLIGLSGFDLLPASWFSQLLN